MISPEEYVKQHQKAFRTAFDFLTSHFPPGIDTEWWAQAAQDVTEASILAGEDGLVNGLLATVYNYLEDEYKQRRNGNAETDD